MSQINITVEEFISTYQNIIGYDADSQCAYDLINRARIIAYPMGDWIGTMVYRPVTIDNGCFYLPYDLDVIRQAKDFCGRSITVSTEVSKSDFCDCTSEVMVHVDGRAYLPFQLTEGPLCFFAINKGDKDVNLRAVYLDKAGTMRDEEMNLGHTINEATRLQHIPETIQRISKPKTKGLIGVMQGSNIGYISPEDKSPSYTIYCIDGVCNARCIVIHAKRKYIPYDVNDANTVLDINPEALSSLIIAVKKKDNGGDRWSQDYAASVKIAGDFLKAEITNEKSTSIGIQPVNFHSQLTEDLLQSNYQ